MIRRSFRPQPWYDPGVITIPLPPLARSLALLSPADRRVIAHGWGVEADAAPELAALLTTPERVGALWTRLSEAARAALVRVLGAGGSLPVAILQRECGPIREPAQFANPRAYLAALQTPPSAAEQLFLLGLLMRHHDERGALWSIPREFVASLPVVAPPLPRLDVPAHPTPDVSDLADWEKTQLALFQLLEVAQNGGLHTLNDGALNKASITRAHQALAATFPVRELRRESDWPWLHWLRTLAVSAKLLRRASDGLLQPTAGAIGWLRATPAERAQLLLEGWITSELDEFTALGGFQWRSKPLHLSLPTVRRRLLELLCTLPPATWFHHDDVVAAVERVDPYFLRPDGRWDTWLLYDQTGQSMAGAQHWAGVEGWFVRAALDWSLHLLGLLDRAGDAPQLARINALGAHLLHNAPAPPTPPSVPIVVQTTLEVICPPHTSWYVRFQLARIAEPVQDDAAAVFRLTRAAVVRAADAGIDAPAILAFLAEAAATPVPAAVAYRIQEWSAAGGQVVVEEATLVRGDAVLLEELRRTKTVQLQPAEELRPDLWRIPTGDAPELVARLRREGFGVQSTVETANVPLSEHDLRAVVTAAHAYAAACAELALPCAVSDALLGRLGKLLPSRQLWAARQAAHEFRQHLNAAALQSEGVTGANEAFPRPFPPTVPTALLPPFGETHE